SYLAQTKFREFGVPDRRRARYASASSALDFVDKSAATSLNERRFFEGIKNPQKAPQGTLPPQLSEQGPSDHCRQCARLKWEARP
ncbi:MAG: hypothetical protein WCD68_08385, partial [Candidatus Acidiferrum sp.]